jgi:YidC/Oxa1 family membrane protein insertase
LFAWHWFVNTIAAGLDILAVHTGSAGLAIIIFTVLIKTFLLPLTIKSVRSTSSMQAVQPKLKEIQKKYAGDRAKIQAEQMKLYQEHGVNPISGCLPMLLQMPIFFGLYYAIRHLSQDAVGLWGQSFLWLPSLAVADPYHLLPILAAVFQFIQVRMSRPAGVKSDDPQQKMMATASNFMPFTVIVIGWVFPSGPVLYWAVSALYSVIQQWFITGWGSLLEWLPFLPDLPEHKRLGYEKPEKRAARIATSANSSGGFTGFLNRQFANQVQKVESASIAQQQATAKSNGKQAKPDSIEVEGKVAQKPGAKANGKPAAPARDGKQPSDDHPPTQPSITPRKARSSKRKRSVESE